MMMMITPPAASQALFAPVAWLGFSAVAVVVLVVAVVIVVQWKLYTLTVGGRREGRVLSQRTPS